MQSQPPDSDLTLLTVSCGHTFHQACIDKWVNSIERQNYDKCPVCRESLPLSQLAARGITM